MSVYDPYSGRYRTPSTWSYSYAPSSSPLSTYAESYYSTRELPTGQVSERMYFNLNGKLVRSYKIRSYRGIASSRIQFYVMRPGYYRGQYISFKSYIAKHAWAVEIDSLAEHDTVGIDVRDSVSVTELGPLGCEGFIHPDRSLMYTTIAPKPFEAQIPAEVDKLGFCFRVLAVMGRAGYNCITASSLVAHALHNSFTLVGNHAASGPRVIYVKEHLRAHPPGPVGLDVDLLNPDAFAYNLTTGLRIQPFGILGSIPRVSNRSKFPRLCYRLLVVIVAMMVSTIQETSRHQ
ncbi:hypothetical protein H4582DRAFT_2126531 [Lactarius indigo]|nr:hypothetical protein H4582DRAFT_2126531 [Lactarius indigo]